MNFGSNPPIIKLENVIKSFRQGFLRRRRAAVDKLNLEITSGNLTGFLGPNGAGKTTTLNLILGFLFPDSGSIQLFGLPPADARSRLPIGYLSETPQADGFETGSGFLFRMDAISGRKAVGRRKRVLDALSQVDLQDVGKKLIRSYSKGMMQRIGLAQALLGNPELLVLDEPMSNMDPLQRERVKVLLVQRKSEGKTTLFSTHNLDDVENLCDQIIVLHKGRKVAAGSLEELAGESDNYIVEFQTDLDLGEKEPDLVPRLTRVKCENCTNRWQVQVSASEKEELLLALIKGRARILSIRSVQRSLAVLFHRLVKEEGNEQ